MKNMDIFRTFISALIFLGLTLGTVPAVAQSTAAVVSPATNPLVNGAVSTPTPKGETVTTTTASKPGTTTPVLAPTLAPTAAPPASELQPATAAPPALTDLLGQVGKSPAPANDQTDPGEMPMDETAIPGLDLPVSAALNPDDMKDQVRREAYDKMMEGLLPMSPEELRDAFGKIDVNQKAIEEPISFPKPEISFTTISLDPAATPLTFKLATGHVTTVNFLDITGQPWPIKDLTWAGNFEIKSSSQGADENFPAYPNLLRIIPLSEHAYGNMSLRMLGLSTPITFTLRTNKDVVQYRLDLRVPEKGPLAMPSIINQQSNDLEAGNTTLTRIMEGVPPAVARKLNINGVDGRTTGYQVDGTMYLRTPLTLLSPAWNSSVRSADGMNVYALSLVPVLLLSDQGQMVRAGVGEGMIGANP
jgi:intracellular multiplication protein IcmK